MTDAHCHPRDLLLYLKNAEEERRETGTAAAASSWNLEEFEYHEGLARKAEVDGAPRLFCCFALHPQLSADSQFYANTQIDGGFKKGGFTAEAGFELLRSLAAQGRVDAVGETGFDLFDDKYRAGEKLQEEMFVSHLETALKYDLPVIIHARKAMHKLFPYAEKLKKLPAIVFHSWPGTKGEGEAWLKKGVNAFFSFGSVVLKNHKDAMASAACFPAERILLETDAPYQPLRGKSFSSYGDLKATLAGIAALRKEAGSSFAGHEELEQATTGNFFRVFLNHNS